MPGGLGPHGEDRAASHHHGELPGRRHRAEPADRGDEGRADGVEHVAERTARRRQRGGIGIAGVHGHGGCWPTALPLTLVRGCRVGRGFERLTVPLKCGSERAEEVL